MDWQDYSLARRYLQETFLDSRIRQETARARAIEDAKFARSAKALRRTTSGVSDLG